MIRCIAIDDEALALDLVEDNIRKVPWLEFVKGCRSAVEATELLGREKIDLIFLDIQMPDFTGIQFLKSLQSSPMVIFTTAYEKYALEGFELDVIDYLLKPYSFDRFMKAVTRAKEYHDLKERAGKAETSPGMAPSAGYIFVKADYKLVKVDFTEILYIEGLKDYIRICTGGKPVMTLMSLKSIGEKLPAGEFVRVHRSFIVALKKIRFIQRNIIHIGDREIPVSDLYKEHFFNRISQDKTEV